MITSPQNPFIKHLHKLSESARHRRETGETVLDGAHLLDACLSAGQRPERVLAAEGALEKTEIRDLLERAGCPVEIASDTAFARASELKTPTGILAVYRPAPPRRERPRAAVWLDEVQDPGNVGSILRTAAAAGFEAAYLSDGCADAWSPRVLRAAMGAHFALDLHPHVRLPELAAAYRGLLLTTTLEGSESVFTAGWGDVERAWIFGNEGSGVDPELLALAHHRIRIPMPGAVESLNVAAAAAVCLFEDVRRRTNAEPSKPCTNAGYPRANRS